MNKVLVFEFNPKRNEYYVQAYVYLYHTHRAFCNNICIIICDDISKLGKSNYYMHDIYVHMKIIVFAIFQMSGMKRM